VNPSAKSGLPQHQKPSCHDGILVESGRVVDAMRDFLLDLVLPPSDRAVMIQWAVMVPFWLAVLVVTRHRSKDTRTFIIGLAVLNLAWFAARTIH
jgi:hypothetical protein